MAQAYSDPKREDDPYTLPDIAVWQDKVYLVECRCGEYEIPEPASFDDVLCPSCECEPKSCDGISTRDGRAKLGWFYWFCFPGCLPDSDAQGPFATKEDALADAREGIED